MSEEQIQKLRRIILGIEKISSFSENEIEELEKNVAHTAGFTTVA
jgi:archaellum component FlaC